MSWIPAAGGLREVTSHPAPKHSASTPVFTFGRAQQQQQQEQAVAGDAAARGPANYDPPASELKWWKQPRSTATVSGTAASDVEAFWQAKPDRSTVAALVNTEALAANRTVGKGSSTVLGDRETYRLADAIPAYRQDFCATHVHTGRRGVQQSAEAMEACRESKQQAQRNKAIGNNSNLRLAQFE